MGSTKTIKALPYPVYYWTLGAIAVIGLADAIYLSLSHYRNYTDIAYASFCAFSRSINCDTVSQSVYSVFLGLPVPIWGVLGYVTWLLLMVPAYRKNDGSVRMYALLFLVALVFCLISLVLAYVAAEFVHASCIMCILSWGINFALLFYTWLIRRRFCSGPFFAELIDDLKYLVQSRARAFAIFTPLVALILILYLLMPRYWIFTIDYSKNLPQGITEQGHPWIGAENPELVIEEFSDYLCFQCAKIHFYLRRLVQENPRKLRLVHRHYPMDHNFNPLLVKAPYHEGSGKLALIAIFAGVKGKFWETNDYFFINARNFGSVDLETLAKRLALDPEELERAVRYHKLRSYLHKEILDGNRLGIVGTPSFIIDGELYEGQLPEALFKKPSKLGVF